ncbi:DUF861 domain-containing protein [Burkholderia stagnalis]|uniref:cupin domain-containing protein n=1 Tax=Burkholderia stagnalis TaxID=1503054 RepID=UPI000F5989A3|nr:cupin domain-containing protein [Burkholderia stagnalis]RQQ40425.1 DUF861 domain-containing protein [Burkholderia stagnalis]RQY60081.1 DUF861 domain-containing protein [Burkholderia stagnalis]
MICCVPRRTAVCPVRCAGSGQTVLRKIACASEAGLPETRGTAGLPGACRCNVKEAEEMHFLSGAGTFAPGGRDALEFGAGDTLFFAASTGGLWQVREAPRKVCASF